MDETKPHILVVEDDRRACLELQVLVEQCGGVPVGPVDSVEAANWLIGRVEIDGALLDTHVGDAVVWPVAEKLEDRHIPFVLFTEGSRYDMPMQYAGGAVVAKPFAYGDVRRALAAIGVTRKRRVA